MKMRGSKKKNRANERKSSSKKAALAYAEAGLAVSPLHGTIKGRCTCGDPECKEPGRHPRTEHGIEDAATDSETIGGWWDQWPKAKIVIATGTIIAVTVTTGGHAAWRTLQQNHGALPKTPQLRTSKLRIYLLKAPPDAVPEGKVRLAKGITLHGHGSYIVAPRRLGAPKSERHFVKGLAVGEIDFAPPPYWLLGLISSDAGSGLKRKGRLRSPSTAAGLEVVTFDIQSLPLEEIIDERPACDKTTAELFGESIMATGVRTLPVVRRLPKEESSETTAFALVSDSRLLAALNPRPPNDRPPEVRIDYGLGSHSAEEGWATCTSFGRAAAKR